MYLILLFRVVKKNKKSLSQKEARRKKHEKF